jgi:ureidoglycolate hydrolase
MSEHTPEPVTKPVPADALRLEALTAAAFEPFGEVIGTDGREAEEINDGRTRKFADLARGVWHHYQVTLGEPSDYLVIDRAGPGANFEERRIEPPLVIRRLSLS